MPSPALLCAAPTGPCQINKSTFNQAQRECVTRCDTYVRRQWEGLSEWCTIAPRQSTCCSRAAKPNTFAWVPALCYPVTTPALTTPFHLLWCLSPSLITCKRPSLNCPLHVGASPPATLVLGHEQPPSREITSSSSSKPPLPRLPPAHPFPLPPPLSVTGPPSPVPHTFPALRQLLWPLYPPPPLFPFK